MTNIQRTLILVIVFFMSLNTVYAAKKYISIRQYQDASCADYKGTWEGFATDPGELFKNGGPWPILIHLYSHNGRIIGKSAAVEDVFPEKEIWAECRKGKLRNIFWGAKGSCGNFSQKGLLVSKNVVLMELHYENAMTNANILVALTRKSNNYPFSVPKEKEDFKVGHVKTCH